MSEWIKKKGHFWYSTGEQQLIQVFCGVVGIPYNTLVKFVGEKKLINREVGCGVRHDSLISSKKQKFITDVMARKDSDN